MAPVTLRSAVVIGTGLIGTSIALAMRECGVRVWLSDRDPTAARLAADLGAGEVLPERGRASGPRADETRTMDEPRATGVRRKGAEPPGPPGQSKPPGAPEPPGPPGQSKPPGTPEPPGPEPWADLVVIAVPPAAVAASLATAQAASLARWYTDVASVKSMPLAAARDLGCDLGSFAGGHPLSGRERSGPAPARADLFLGRPWVICPGEGTAPETVAAVTALARCCRAEPVLLSPAEHDACVALVSHAPHLVAAAMAARLAEAPPGALALSGPGVADVTRIAGGDPGLWAQILAANAAPVADVVAAVAADLAAVAEALRDAVRPAPSGHGCENDPLLRGTDSQPRGGGTGHDPALKVLLGLLEAGVTGVARVPGKRGKPRRDDVVVQVVIGDRPGELARLFQAAGDAGVNIEDVGIEHSPGLPVGVAELTVAPAAAAPLAEALAAAGWPVRR